VLHSKEQPISFFHESPFSNNLPSLLVKLSTQCSNTYLFTTGGALGIGAELVRLLHSSGSNVFFGDVLIPQGEALASELSALCAPGQVVKFLYTNVQHHLSNLGLFELAYKTCGRVDHAVSVAGTNKEENIVDENLTLESVRKVKNYSFSPQFPFFDIPIFGRHEFQADLCW
jgi:NAD(P)-dependent dehydrogenase (short-subunit alcohol dehydrogenase family)